MPTLTSELKILITPELRAQIDAARTTREGTVSLAEWVRGAIEGRLMDRERVRGMLSRLHPGEEGFKGTGVIEDPYESVDL